MESFIIPINHRFTKTSTFKQKSENLLRKSQVNNRSSGEKDELLKDNIFTEREDEEETEENRIGMSRTPSLLPNIVRKK